MNFLKGIEKMKILKKRLMVVVMSLALFLTGIFAVGGIDSKKADAFSPNYNGDPYTIIISLTIIQR